MSFSAHEIHDQKMAALGRTLADVSHALATPLSILVGNIDPLLKQVRVLETHPLVAGDAPLRACVAHLRRLVGLVAEEAERTTAAASDLRAFARGGDGVPGRTDLHDCIELSLRLLKSRFGQRIAIETNYARTAGVIGFREQLHLLTMNLLTNACDAIDGPGTFGSARGWRTSIWSSRSETTAAASSRPTWHASSIRTSRPRPKVRATVWGWPFAMQSSSSTAGGSTPCPLPPLERRSLCG